MKRDMKKIFAFVLVLVMAFSLMPLTPAFAVNAVGSGMTLSTGADAPTVLPGSLSDGQIWTDKSVVHADGGAFNITLKAVGQNYKYLTDEDPTPLDVVFVLDVSGSMTNNGSQRLAHLKVAATSAAGIFLKAGSPNRVAVVRYGESASTVNELAGPSGLAGLKTSIANLSNSGVGQYTNIQAGILQGQKVLYNRTDATGRKAVIVLMTDGEANRYYSTSAVAVTASPGSVQSNNDENARKAVRAQGMAAKDQDQGIDIYTVGFGIANDNARDTIAPGRPGDTTYAAFKYWKGSYLTEGDSLTEMLAYFEGLAYALTEHGPNEVVEGQVKTWAPVTITDVIGDGFEIVEPLPDGVAYDSTTRTVTWKIPGDNFATNYTMPAGSTSLVSGRIATVTFTVQLTPEAAGIPKTYYTNESARYSFEVAAANPVYPDDETTVSDELGNKGWATVGRVDSLTVAKIVDDEDGVVPEDTEFGFRATIYAIQNDTSIYIVGSDTVGALESGDFTLTDGGIKTFNYDWVFSELNVESLYFTIEETTRSADDTSIRVDGISDYDRTGDYTIEGTVYSESGGPVITYTNTYNPAPTPDKPTLTIYDNYENENHLRLDESGERNVDSDVNVGRKSIPGYSYSSVEVDPDEILSISGSNVTGSMPDRDVIITYYYTKDDDGGGGGGGDDDDDTPNRPNTPNTPVVIPNEPTPAGPVIIDEAVPAGPLPKTGGVPAILLYGLGALLAGGGTAIKLRKKDK